MPKPLIGGFVAALLTLLINSLIPPHYVDQLIQSGIALQASRTLGDSLSNLRIDLTDAETGQRGYLLTHNPTYLEPYTEAISHAHGAIESVRGMLADDEAQLQRLQRVEKLANEKLAELKQTVELTQAGRFDDALRIVNSGQGNMLMQSLREEIGAIDETGDSQYDSGVKNTTATAQSALFAFAITAVLDAALFLAIFYYARRLLQSLTKAEAGARAQSSIMRAVLNSMHDGVMVVDPHGDVTICNPAAERLLDWRIPSLAHARQARPYVVKHIDGSTIPNEDVPLARSLRGEIIVAEQMELVWPTGESIWLSVNSTPILEQDNDSKLGAVAVLSNITDRKKAEASLLEMNEQLSNGLTELSIRNVEISLLSELTNIMQSCVSEKEACDVLKSYAPKLFDNIAGGLYLAAPSKNYLDLSTHWGDVGTLPAIIAPDDCWALRLGKTRRTDNIDSDLCCSHILKHSQKPQTSLCVPMAAQGETIGVLFLLPPVTKPKYDGLENFTVMVAEQCGLAVSNLRLRDQLRYQSMHDPLTGLFNRRFLEASLDIELRQARRMQTPMCVAMMDLDHFKRFNDTFGHEAGDVLLRAFGGVLKTASRDSDIACRYGGEEFLLILPNTSIESAQGCIERLLEAVRNMEVTHASKLLGRVTISVGLANYPAHGESASALVQRADAALYEAKTKGRDQCMLAA
ncbi:MAG: hypothetical protein JWM03_1348 [Rhodocyclales bacterium]|nr:hypothetical protein [Rhodocyclales bacterium]